MFTKKIYTTIGLFTAFLLNAQVGVIYKPSGNFTPHSSAILHLETSNLPDGQKKGFLMTRNNLKGNTDQTTIANPIAGLWVYNINTTTGTDAVFADRLYMWSGTRWESYYSKLQIESFLQPNNYYLKSVINQTLSGTPLTNFNAGTATLVTWDTSDVTIANDTQIQMVDATEFEAKKSGVFDVAGFFSYHPEITSTTTTSNVLFILQKNTGAGWQNYTTVTKTVELLAGGTYQSVSIPSTALSLNVGDKIRFAFQKTAGSNHGTNAGIKATTGQGTKSLRISYLSDL